MIDLTFGEQVKIVLSRKGMTIKELAERVEERTGKPMSRQNMTQRLGRDNFQEQDMRLIAEILGCPFRLDIVETQEEGTAVENKNEPVQNAAGTEDENPVKKAEERVAEVSEEKKVLQTGGFAEYFYKNAPEKQDNIVVGDINPYTGKEYETDSVRMHPDKIGYVQVYDRERHAWNDMTEWAFLGYQERKKKLLGKDYRPPVCLD